MPVAMPTSTPKPLIGGHAQAEADIGETCEFEAGEARRAPIYLTVPNVVRARWLLNQAQFDDFHDWYEDDLLAGSLTFSLPIAEQGGPQASIIETEALFLAPPVERMIHGGFWEVSATCATGIPFDDGIIETNCINETFSSGISAYDTISGTVAGFGNFSAGSYGQGLRMTAGAGPSVSAIERSFSARDVYSVRFKFRLEALNSDDAGWLILYAGGSVIFYIDPRRELLFSGGIGNAIGAVGNSVSAVGLSPAALDVNEWYQFRLDCAASSSIVITRLSDSAVIQTTSVGDHSTGLPGVDALRFLIDEGGATMSTTTYADIHICGLEEES